VKTGENNQVELELNLYPSLSCRHIQMTEQTIKS